VTRVALATALTALLASTATHARAADPAPSSSATTPAATILLAAMPVFGAAASVGDGWTEIVARVENVSPAPIKGTVELESAVPGHRGLQESVFTATAPFNVAAGKSVVVRLPTHGFGSYGPTVTLRALAETHAELARTNVPVQSTVAPLLVDAEATPKLNVVMNAWPVAHAWNPHAGSYAIPSTTAASPLSVGAPGFDRTTGDPVLPDRAAAYAAVSVVVIRSDLLAKLEGLALEALVGWVATGGELAVVPTRPEDLRAGTLATLVGGAVGKGDVPSALYSYPAPDKPPNTGTFDPGDIFDTPPGTPTPTNPFATPDAGATPIAWHPFIPAKSSTKPPTFRAGPLPAVREKLVGFSGGNLRPSPYGATAPYGLGEVHLLAFDPTTLPAIDDAWTHGRIVELVGRAWDRRAKQVFPHGGGEARASSLYDLRRLLDPNENFRVALGVSALLLVVYSIVAGPLTYLRATRKGKPLDPLLWAPIWSAVAFGLILLVGLAGKGWRGRARHVALVEAGAGVTRGAIRRYRGFFSSQTRSLTIAATDRSCVLDVVASDSKEHGDAIMRLDRNGARLENLTALPWQTVVVAEDGLYDFKGGISILPSPDGSADVVNRSGRELRELLVYVPLQGIHYIPVLKDGDRVRASTGKLLLTAHARTRTSAGTLAVHPFDPAFLGSMVGGKEGTHVQETWTPIVSSSGSVTDWFPDDAAVVLAEIAGGEGAKSDSGLSVENDRLLVRIVGEGGAP
jgi:hypothetical protein